MPEEGQDMAATDFRRRMPSIFRRINEIKQDDMRVSVIGTVIDRADDGIVIDDGTGKIDIVMPNAPDTEVRKLVRVFGRVVPTESGFQLQGEIVQDMSRLDVELLKKVESIKV